MLPRRREGVGMRASDSCRTLASGQNGRSEALTLGWQVASIAPAAVSSSLLVASSILPSDSASGCYS